MRDLRLESLEQRQMLTIMIDVGDHVLAPNTAGQVIQITATSDNPTADQVTGFKTNAQLGDGTGEMAEPVFENLDYADSIWTEFARTEVGGPVAGAEQFAQGSVVFNTSGDSVAADGLTVTLVIDTTGFASGQFDLKFKETQIGDDSVFIAEGGGDISAVITNGTITIGNPAATLAIAADDADKAEGNDGNTGFTFTVTRSGGTSGTSTVDYAVGGSGNDPANGADFGGTLPSGTVSFATGETSQVVTVNVSGDTAVEPDEGFTVALSNPSGSATITTATADGTIQNDDSSGTPSIIVGDHDLLPDTANQVISILVTGASDVTGMNVRAQIGDGTGPQAEPNFADVDFTGGIWDAHPNTVTGGPVSGAEQFLQGSVVFNNMGDEVSANGVVVKLVVDTTGFTEGEFDLRLSDTDIGVDSAFILEGGADLAPAVTNGTITIGEHEDSDNISDDVEDGAPNDGDGNSDGTPDSQQDNVASLPNLVDDTYVTLTAPSGTSLSNVGTVDNPSPDDAPPDASFPVGFFDFTLGNLSDGNSATVTILLHGAETVNTYYNYGPTPDNAGDHWYPFTYDGETGAVIHADRIELHYVDGLRGDGDLAANGIIVDPGAPGVVDLPWRNPVLPQDVNNDGNVSPLDVLVLIADLNANGSTVLPMFPEDSRPIQPPYVDVAGDGNTLSPLDVLSVIAYINSEGAGEGEALNLATTSTRTHTPVVSPTKVPLSASLQFEHVQQQPERRSADTVLWLTEEKTWNTEDPQSATDPALLPSPSQDHYPFDTDDGLTDLDAVLADIAQDIEKTWQGS